MRAKINNRVVLVKVLDRNYNDHATEVESIDEKYAYGVPFIVENYDLIEEEVGNILVVKFEVGKTYITEDWFCGGWVCYKVVDRSEDSITVTEDGSEDTQIFSTFLEDGTECFSLGEYLGNKHIVRAKQDE